MTAVAVTFDGTRLNDSDANTGWGNFQPSTGGAPSSEGANAYQISTGAAANTGVVGRQSQSTTGRRGVDYNGASVDYTAAANRLFYLKCYVSDAFDLNATWGVEVAMGSSDGNNDHRYNVAGSGANLSVYDQYPPQGGYLITCIDPTIDTWKETENGTLDQTAIVWYAMGAQMINGNSKSENVAFDAIDYGTGLTLLNGTGADDPGKYTDYVVTDQDDKNNRWGAAVGAGNFATLRGIMTVGASGTATEFDDSTSVVTFPDGYHSRGLFGVVMDINNASSVINDGALLIGAGTRNGVDANDTRPDYTVNGTAGTYTCSAQIRNFRDVDFSSAADVDGADIECMLLVQNSCDIANSTIRSNALTNVACLQDPTFGTTTDLHDTEFIQSGVGHAIEVLGTSSLTNIGFTGYGGTPGSNLVAASGAADAAIFNDTGGAITITVLGGDTPSVRNGAGATTTVVSAVSQTVQVDDADGNPVAGARVRVERADTGAQTAQGETNALGTYTDSTFNYTVDVDVVVKVRLKGFKNFRTNGTITSSGLSVGVLFAADPIVDLP